MKFQHMLDADTNGTYLCGYISDAAFAACQATFGSSEGYYDSERGYNGCEWQFTDDSNNLYNVYNRFGSPRVGGRNLSPEQVAALEAWLIGQGS